VNEPNRIAAQIGKSPILWGCVLSAGFYGLIQVGVLTHPLVEEYFAGHPIEYATTTMFFVGLAFLGIRLVELVAARPRPRSESLLLGPIPAGGQPVSTCSILLGRLEAVGGREGTDPLLTRLREALEWVRRQNSAEGLDGELKFLAARDADMRDEDYDLFRVVTWAIPILGFLGTVVGITLAIANLESGPIEEMIKPTTAALAVAFATTTQALALSIVLMFLKYLVARAEGRRAAYVDRQTDAELLGRFEVVAVTPDGQLTAVRRMAETVLGACDEMVRRQAELWAELFQAAGQQWAQAQEAAGRRLDEALMKSLQHGLKAHAAALAEQEQAAARCNAEHWDRVQQALVEAAQATVSLQKGIQQQTGVLQQTVEATGQVARLEEALNRNLAALAGAKHFEQTVTGLAAALQLLSARLGDAPGRVHLDRVRDKPHAA